MGMEIKEAEGEKYVLSMLTQMVKHIVFTNDKMTTQY